MTDACAAYCVLDSDACLPEGLTGVHGGIVQNLPYRGIGVAVSPLAGPVRDIVAGAVQHETVVEWLMERYTVLPMRFPTVLAGQEAVLALMSQRFDSFCASLRRLRHHVEFGVRVLWPATQRSAAQARVPAAHEPSGTQYLRERYGRYRCNQALREQADQFGRKLDAALSEFVTAKKLRRAAADAFAFEGVYLVDRDKGAAFRQALAEVRRAEPDLEYLLSGPWPPYNFTIG